MGNKKVIGVAHVSAWAGVDDNGEAMVQGPVVEVNTKGPTAPGLKHVSAIARKKYTLTEEENPDAYIEGKRMVAYEKKVNGKQTDFDGKESGYVGDAPKHTSGKSDYVPEQGKSGDINNPLTWAKNMINNLWQGQRDQQWVNIAFGAAIAAIAVGTVYLLARGA